MPLSKKIKDGKKSVAAKSKTSSQVEFLSSLFEAGKKQDKFLKVVQRLDYEKLNRVVHNV